ncbi:AfsR/SARP family transcriptional regulator [Actinomadura viridis]|uniref:ATPase/DNA-binding SARP family transcriptional activator n=1 Tax=Actinomadura viridis TaxID=58110 RepID=A0A931GMR9_9ACTN|nr:BTAD domain-containing putative transcriptional regulator [Actinomadura viridis]MBG6093543.1 putative ATPase/DNA-binding SARP family transcriptional activator [Actinomadura viridis]
MRFGVLGPLAVWTDDGAAVPVPGLKVRALLADLLLHEGRPVPADRLIDDLWGDDLPGNPPAALSAKVSQLRRVLGDAEPGARGLVVTRPAGYVLDVEPGRIDAHRFRSAAARAREAAGPEARAALLAEALGLWRGGALADFADEPFSRAAIARLEELRLTTLEDHAEVRLELGEHGVLAGELGDLLAAHPLRERLRAAHMRALYRSGRQSEALESYEALRVRLADELGLDPGAELTALHRAILVQAPELAARPVPAPAADEGARPRTNLLPPPSDLIGRDEALASIRARLASDRLVTLTGPGGVGKTRLATEAGLRAAEAPGDGVWMVELAAFERSATVDELTDGVLAVLDVHDAASLGTPAERLAGALAGRRPLLVLDNCEHVVDQAAELARLLLDAATGVRLLATSREPLGLPGEVVWAVPPLEVPGRADGADPAELERSSAVRLFVTRAAAAARGFRLDADTAPAVSVLCRRLDGIPLALELAATRVRTLGVHGLVARLDDRFRLLATGHRGAPPRQRTLMAMIEWSWDLLPEPERAVLRRLAVHADGCSLEAAEAVCAGADIPVPDVLDLLARLVDRSLVVMTDHAAGPRYRLLESVDAYCADRLAEAGEHDEVLARHHRYYTDLAVRAEPHLYGADQDRWLRLLDTEAANLRVALGGPDALRLANALTWYWFLRGRLAEALRSLEAALVTGGDAASRARATAWRAGLGLLNGDDTGWLARREEALALLGDCPARDRARAQWFLAYAGSQRGDVAVGAELLDAAQETFRATGDHWGEAAVLLLRAQYAHHRGEPAVLEREAGRAARLFGRAGDRWGGLHATGWLSAGAELAGDYDRARALQHDGLRMAEELHLWPEVASRNAWLGWITLQSAEPATARAYCELVLASGDRQSMVLAELVLGFAARYEGDADEAEIRLRTLLLASVPPDGEAPPPLYLSLVYIGLGHAAELRGDLANAVDLHRRALTLAVRMDGPRDTAFSLEGMASALSLAGRDVPGHAEQAARFLGAATAVRAASGLSPGPAERGDIARTEARLRDALPAAVLDERRAEGDALTPSACLDQAHTLHL